MRSFGGTENACFGVEFVNHDPVNPEVGHIGESIVCAEIDRMGMRSFLSTLIDALALVPDIRNGGSQLAFSIQRIHHHVASHVVGDKQINGRCHPHCSDTAPRPVMPADSGMSAGRRIQSETLKPGRWHGPNLQPFSFTAYKCFPPDESPGKKDSPSAPPALVPTMCLSTNRRLLCRSLR